MTVRKKIPTALKSTPKNIDDVINRGGRTTRETEAEIEQLGDEEIRFTLRIPMSLIEKIDSERRSRVGNVSRNQWILEAIANKF